MKAKIHLTVKDQVSYYSTGEAGEEHTTQEDQFRIKKKVGIGLKQNAKTLLNW